MNDNSVALNLILSIIKKTEDGKIIWQINSDKSGFIGYMNNYSLEILIPSKSDAVRASMSFGLIGVDNSRPLIYKPREDEYSLIIRDLKTGKPVMEIANSLFSVNQLLSISLNRQAIEKIAKLASDSITEKQIKEAEKALLEVDNL